MRKHTSIISLAVLGSLWTIGIAPHALAENLVGDAVILRTLDKVTATTKDYKVKVGESLTYGSLRVDVKHCEKKPPEDIPETFAFLQIFDRRTDGQGTEAAGEKLFSGWMLASKPAVSALEHPVYDVWVLGCDVPPPPPNTELEQSVSNDPFGLRTPNGDVTQPLANGAEDRTRNQPQLLSSNPLLNPQRGELRLDPQSDRDRATDIQNRPQQDQDEPKNDQRQNPLLRDKSPDR